jgi:hypothetical protein
MAGGAGDAVKMNGIWGDGMKKTLDQIKNAVELLFNFV